MTVIYPTAVSKTEGFFELNKGLYYLKDIFLIRQCGITLEINYKEKPKEKIKCSANQVANVIQQLMKS